MIFRLIFLPCLSEQLLLASQKYKTLHRSSFLRFAVQLSLCRSFLLRGGSLRSLFFYRLLSSVACDAIFVAARRMGKRVQRGGGQ